MGVVVVSRGAIAGWYRGGVLRAHVAGSLKLKEPGEVHRDVRVRAPFTLQGAGFTPEIVAAAADAMGLRGAVCFRAPGFAPGERAAELAFRHARDALVRDGAVTSNARRWRPPREQDRLASTPASRRAPQAEYARAHSCTTRSPTRSRSTIWPRMPGSTSFTWCAPSGTRWAYRPTSI